MCVCGHFEDEHLRRGDDPEVPNSTACEVEDCGCAMFEGDE